MELVASGGITARDLCERSLARTHDEVARSALITTTPARARREADRSDQRARSGRVRSELDGVPITFKDLFDVAGTVTTAGSASRSIRPPASADSHLVRRAHDLGLVMVGKTNLSEFAFSGLGINRHFGTPINPNDPTLIPGGSSSGAAVAVASGIAPLAIGTDTSGSVRVPAAFCGCVGFRASKNRYGPDDFTALSPTLDSVGIIARTIGHVAMLDRLLTKPWKRNVVPHKVIRAVVPAGEWIDDATPHVRELFDRAVDALRDSGIPVKLAAVPSLDHAQRLMDAYGTIVGAEAYAAHGHLLSAPTGIEPATRRRLARNVEAGKEIKRVRSAMASLRRQFEIELDGAALLCPTVRHEPPRLDALLASDDLYDERNASTLRTTMALSYLGTCGVSLPLRGPDGRATVGLLASLPEGHDRRLLTFGQTVAAILAAMPTQSARRPQSHR
jgi:aspartyl-tRNA(Asn)/glutamyl-tRNA(Gln) amidotransferase subunit A